MEAVWCTVNHYCEIVVATVIQKLIGFHTRSCIAAEWCIQSENLTKMIWNAFLSQWRPIVIFICQVTALADITNVQC